MEGKQLISKGHELCDALSPFERDRNQAGGGWGLRGGVGSVTLW